MALGFGLGYSTRRFFRGSPMPVGSVSVGYAGEEKPRDQRLS